MLSPAKSLQGIDAEGLLAAATLRDDSIKITKPSQLTLVTADPLPGAPPSRYVRVDDNPMPQPLKVMARYLKAPSAFLNSADMELAQYVVNFQLDRVKNTHEVVYNDGKAVGSQEVGRVRLQGVEIVQRLIDNVGQFRRANFYDMGDYVDITVAGDKVTLRPKPQVDDITEGGFRMLYSEIMARAPTIEPYIERLVCTNGMVCREHTHAFKFDSLKDFLEQFDDSIEKANAIVDKTVRAQLEKAANTKVERSEQALRTIFETQRISPRLLPGAIEALMNEDDGSAYGVLQAITRAANSVNYSRRLLLQENAAKELTRLDKAHCPTCWSTSTH